NLQVALRGQGPTRDCFPRGKSALAFENRPVVSRLRTLPHEREGLERTTKTERSRTPLDRLQNYACAIYLIKILYELSYIYPDRLCHCCNTVEYTASRPRRPLKRSPIG